MILNVSLLNFRDLPLLSFPKPVTQRVILTCVKTEVFFLPSPLHNQVVVFSFFFFLRILDLYRSES